MNPQIAIYTSDHGFGHAMRAVFLAEALIERGCHCHIVADRPDWLFARLPEGTFTLHRRRIDAGLVQRDWLTLDLPATLRRHRTHFADSEALIRRELAFLERIDAALVVAEVPPIAVEIASRADLPAVINANFDWHWLYRELAVDHPTLAPLAAQSKRWYRSATRVLRLPFHADMESTFPELTDIPLMVGRLQRDPAEIRRDLGLPEGEPILMWNFGGHASGSPDFDRISADLPEWHLLSYIDHPTADPRFHRVPDSFNTTEIFSILDALIGKVGYCTCAEACAFQVPFLFFARDGYPEDIPLQEHALRSMNAARLYPDDLPTGRWFDAFRRVTSLPCKEAPPTDGADRAAEIYLDLIG